MINIQINIQGNNQIYLDQLLESFKKMNWNIPENTNYINQRNKQFRLHKFRWPEISLSSDRLVLKNKDDINIIERLAEYKTTNDNAEGRIILYYNEITELALEYLDQNSDHENLSEQDVVDHFTTIILIHEFVHWIMHWKHDPNGFRFIPLLYTEKEEVYFHEQFAQLITYLTIKEDSTLKQLFEWLESKQPKQYKILNENKYNNVELPQVIKVLEFCRIFCGYAIDTHYGQQEKIMKACFEEKIYVSSKNELITPRHYISLLSNPIIKNLIIEFLNDKKNHELKHVLAFLKMCANVDERPIWELEKIDAVAINVWGGKRCLIRSEKDCEKFMKDNRGAFTRNRFS